MPQPKADDDICNDFIRSSHRSSYDDQEYISPLSSISVNAQVVQPSNNPTGYVSIVSIISVITSDTYDYNDLKWNNQKRVNLYHVFW